MDDTQLVWRNVFELDELVELFGCARRRFEFQQLIEEVYQITPEVVVRLQGLQKVEDFLQALLVRHLGSGFRQESEDEPVQSMQLAGKVLFDQPNPFLHKSGLHCSVFEALSQNDPFDSLMKLCLESPIGSVSDVLLKLGQVSHEFFPLRVELRADFIVESKQILNVFHQTLLGLLRVLALVRGKCQEDIEGSLHKHLLLEGFSVQDSPYGLHQGLE